MQKKRIMFVSSEMSPFLETSSIADLALRLPKNIQERNTEIRVFIPRFGVINERRNKLHEVVRLSGININIDDTDYPLTIKVASLPQAKLQVYFLDNEDYFHRKFIFSDENNKFFKDNDERTIFFCKGVLETCKKLGWPPDLIHCQGWMTSLIPLYLKTTYKDDPIFRRSKVVYSVFENQYSSSLGKDFVRKASLQHVKQEHTAPYENGECASMYIGACSYADGVIKASENIHPKVEKYMETQKKKLFLESPQGEAQNLIDVYEEFYRKVLDAK
jgi:starch synthase